MAARSAEESLIQATTQDGWVPEHQIAQMLGLCEAQMDSAQQESDHAVDVLVQAFTALVETTRQVGSTVADGGAKDNSELKEQLAQLSKQMASAVVAFQFYDKLTQRLGHVRYSLSALALFVCNRAQMEKPEQWERLHSTLRRLYRTEAEREVFQLVMDGAETGFVDMPAAQAQGAVTPNSVAAGEVELF